MVLYFSRSTYFDQPSQAILHLVFYLSSPIIYWAHQQLLQVRLSRNFDMLIRLEQGPLAFFVAILYSDNWLRYYFEPIGSQCLEWPCYGCADDGYSFWKSLDYCVNKRPMELNMGFPRWHLRIFWDRSCPFLLGHVTFHCIFVLTFMAPYLYLYPDYRAWHAEDPAPMHIDVRHFTYRPRVRFCSEPSLRCSYCRTFWSYF